MGGFTAIDFKDPAQPVLEKVDFDLDKAGYALCIVDTGGNHADLTGEYAAIPQEMKAVAACLGGEVLRDVDEEKLYANLAEIRAKTGDRAVLRAMHFFDENRVAAAEAEALKNGDFEAFKAPYSAKRPFFRRTSAKRFCRCQSGGTRGSRWLWLLRKNFWRVKVLPGACTAAVLPGQFRCLFRRRKWLPIKPVSKLFSVKIIAIFCLSAVRAVRRFCAD